MGVLFGNFTCRVDQRGFGVVRSDAELKEIMCELYEQDEAPVRHRRTHAAVPPMLVEERERNLRYDNKNGLIADPMALHRESCFMYMWSDEEKATFRDKLVQLLLRNTCSDVNKLLSAWEAIGGTSFKSLWL